MGVGVEQGSESLLSSSKFKVATDPIVRCRFAAARRIATTCRSTLRTTSFAPPKCC